MGFNFKSFIEEIIVKAPAVVQTIEKDKADASTETKTQLAAQALVQASTTAKAVAPGDTATIDAITAVAGGIVSALKAPSPVAGAAQTAAFGS